MFFSVRDLEVRKAHFSTDLAPGEIDFQDQSIRQVGPLHTEGTAEMLSNTLGEIRVHGSVNVDMEADCDRCLEAVRIPVQSDFDLIYQPSALASTGHEVAIDPAESEVGFYEGGGLQLGDILREHILLSVPMQRVCSEACRGICPVCGKNRNQGDCGCESTKVDDRWSVLKSMKNSLPVGSNKKN